MKVLHQKKLHVKLKKCSFLCDNVVFLGSIASVEGLKLDPVKVKAITEWLHLSP